MATSKYTREGHNPAQNYTGDRYTAQKIQGGRGQGGRPGGGGGRGGRMMKVKEKPKDTKYVLLRLGGYLFQYKWLLLLALVLTFASNLLALVGPTLSGYAVDLISLGKGKVDMAGVWHYVWQMMLLYAASALLSFLMANLMLRISQRVVRKMRQDLFYKLQSLPVGYFDTHQTGDILSRMSYDIDTVSTSLAHDLVAICSSTITVVGSFVMMLRISPTLLLVMLITIPMSIYYTRYIARKVRPLSRRRSAALGQMNGFVEEMVSGQKTLKAYAREAINIGHFDGTNEEAVESFYQAEYTSSMMGPTMNFITNLSLALITAFGAVLFLFGKLSIGSISSFVQYSRKFSGPINELANMYSELQSAMAAAERVLKVLDEEPEPVDAPDAIPMPKDIQGRVELSHVKFGYTPDRTILQDVNLVAEPGKQIAIVGPTGAGKTTIINLLMRFYDVNSGSITIDGMDITKVTRESLRKSFAMVLQDTWVFEGTIYDNIAYGKENATREEVIAAAKAAHIHSYISRLPKGYDTPLSDDGTNLSKGQKQLLTIARAMLLDAHMLILDEATSNVDTRTEIHIREAMRKLMKDKTCFVIAHRLSTIVDADIILVVKDGDVIEQGNHTELMEKKGFYHQLYMSQFE